MAEREVYYLGPTSTAEESYQNIDKTGGWEFLDLKNVTKSKLTINNGKYSSSQVTATNGHAVFATKKKINFDFINKIKIKLAGGSVSGQVISVQLYENTPAFNMGNKIFEIKTIEGISNAQLIEIDTVQIYGSYYLGINFSHNSYFDQWWTNISVITTAKMLDELSVGSTIEIDGDPAYKHYWKNSNVYRIADKNHTGYPANSVTIIMDRRYQFPICFDAKEPNNPDANRKSYGNNRYRYSNIHQWQNSNAKAGQWYTAQHEFDEPPISGNTSSSSNLYNSWAGFLAWMGKDFEDKLLPTTVKAAKADVDGGGYETFTAKLFLPSTTEVGLSKDGFTEGSKLALFSDNASRVAYYDADGVMKASSWATRTPYKTNGQSVWYVSSNGNITGANSAYTREAPRPLCNLSGDTEIYGPYPNGHYRLAPKELPTYQNLIIGGAV